MTLRIPSGLSEHAEAFLRAEGSQAEVPAMPSVAKPFAAAFRAAAEAWAGTTVVHYAFGRDKLSPKLSGPALGEVVDEGDEPLIVFGYHWSRPIYLDAGGAVHGHGHDGPALRCLASSVTDLVERLAHERWIAACAHTLELDRPMAAALAEASALEPLPGSAGSWWGRTGELAAWDGRVLEPLAPVTTLAGNLVDVRALCLRAQQIDPPVRARWVTHHATMELWPPSAAPTAPPVAEGVLPLWGPARRGREPAGLLDLREGGLVAYESHEGRVVIRADPGGARSFTEGRERMRQWLDEPPPAATVSWDPRDAMTPDELREAFVSRGLELTEGHLALEAALGGLTFGDEGLSFGFRIWLFSPWHRFSDDAGRVDFGLWGDARILADAEGRLHFGDDIDGTDVLLAEAPEVFLRRHFQKPTRTGADFRVLAHVGAVAAAAVGAERLDEVSDAAERYWATDDVLVHELSGREGEAHTRVVAPSLAVVDAIAGALAEAGVKGPCRTWFRDVRERLEAAGLEAERQVNERLFEPAEPPEASELAAAIGEGGPVGDAAGHPSAAVRLAVARSPAATDQDLGAVIDATAATDREGMAILDAVARHPAAHVHLDRLLAIADQHFEAVLPRAIAMRDDPSPPILERLACSPDPAVRHGAALSPAAAEWLGELAADGDPLVREAVARHPAAPSTLLSELAADAVLAVRRAVADHPAADDATLERLAADPDRGIAWALASREPPPPPAVATRAAYHPWALRRRTARCPSLPASVLRDLAGSSIADCRVGVATNPSTPVEILLGLIDDEAGAVRDAALVHPAIDDSLLPEMLRPLRAKALADRRPEPKFRDIPDRVMLADLLAGKAPFRGSWAGHPTYPVELLGECVEDPEHLVGLAAAKHPWVPPAVLQAMVAHRYSYARRAAAAHPRTPADTLLSFLEDRDAMVRAAAAGNPATPLRAVLELVGDDREVREALAGRADLPTETRRALAADPEEYVRRGVACCEASAPELLTRMAGDDHIQVRSWLPLNPSFPETACSALLDDPERIVRDAAAWRLLGTPHADR